MKLTKFEQAATLLAAICCVVVIIVSMQAGAPGGAVYASGRPADGEIQTGEYPPESDADGKAESDAKDGKINVNTATYAEMVESGRIDAATARLIVAFRSIAGPYASIYELREIDGISSEKFASIEPYVTTGS